MGSWGHHQHFQVSLYSLSRMWHLAIFQCGLLASLVSASITRDQKQHDSLGLCGVDPSKVVFGVAWYGRGYTVSNTSCNTFGCEFSGPSKPGKCTNSAGVLSLIETQKMIEKGEATSRLVDAAAMKELVWDDQ